MAEPTPEEDFSGRVQIRCDYDTYREFHALADNYYTYQHALEDLLRVAEERPDLLRRPITPDGSPKQYTDWG